MSVVQVGQGVNSLMMPHLHMGIASLDILRMVPWKSTTVYQ